MADTLLTGLESRDPAVVRATLLELCDLLADLEARIREEAKPTLVAVDGEGRTELGPRPKLSRVE